MDKSSNDEPRGAEIWFDASDGVISEVTIASNTIQATIQPGGSNIRIWGADTDGVKASRLFTISGNVLGSQPEVSKYAALSASLLRATRYTTLRIGPSSSKIVVGLQSARTRSFGAAMMTLTSVTESI